MQADVLALVIHTFKAGVGRHLSVGCLAVGGDHKAALVGCLREVLLCIAELTIDPLARQAGHADAVVGKVRIAPGLLRLQVQAVAAPGQDGGLVAPMLVRQQHCLVAQRTVAV